MSDDEYYDEDKQESEEDQENNEIPDQKDDYDEDEDKEQDDYGEDLDNDGMISEPDEFKPSFKDMQRVVKGKGVQIGKGKLYDIEQELEKRARSSNPKVYFRELVETIVGRISTYEGPENDYIELKKIINNFPTLEKLYKGIEFIKNVQYKNPAGYLFGFLATNGDKDITDKYMKPIIKLLEEITDKKGNVIKISVIYEDYSIKPPDVVRYAKLWTDIVHNL
jgi:hypothetical protein